jgi:hypothetical protein
MTDYEESDEYKSRCAKRRIIGIVMLVIGGAYLVAVTGTAPTGNDAYNAGRYAVTVVAFIVGFAYLLTKPAVKR